MMRLSLDLGKVPIRSHVDHPFCRYFAAFHNRDPQQRVPTLRATVYRRAAILVLLFVPACNEPDKVPETGAARTPVALRPDSTAPATPPATSEQISRYIRRMFQDRDGNIWFGTTSDGVVRYDGRSLQYFTTQEGLGGNWVNAMAQDAQGDLWFATGGGVSRYDGSG